MIIKTFFDDTTKTISHIIYDHLGGNCAIIEPVLDYDAKSGRTSTLFSDKLIDFIKSQQLTVTWILETHAHADHLSSAHYLKTQLGGKTAIGHDIPSVQKIFRKIFNIGEEFIPNGCHFDYSLTNGEVFQVGKLSAKAISISGHTPADMAYQFDDAIFIGDTLFMPDVGTARADFPGGDAHQLFKSIHRQTAPFNGKTPSLSNVRIIFTYMTASVKKTLSPCVRHEMPRLTCQIFCCHLFKPSQYSRRRITAR